MIDRHYDELAHASVENTEKKPTYKETHDLFYKFDKDEEQVFSSLRSEGYSRKSERDKKIFDLISNMGDDDKNKYSFVPDPNSLKRILGNSSPMQHRKFYDFDKIAVDNGFLTNAQFNEIDQNNSKQLRKLIDKNRKEGGSALAGFTGVLASQVNPLNAPENYVPIFGWGRAASVITKAARFALESVVIQSAIEPQIHNWKDEINSPYELKDSIDNIALAGVFGAGISGVLSGIEGIIKSVKLGKTDKKILQDFVDEVKENPFRDEPIQNSKVVDPEEVIPDSGKAQEPKVETDIDLEIIKEVEDFQMRLNNQKEPIPKVSEPIEKVSAKERVDDIEKDFADELKESKPLDGKQDELEFDIKRDKIEDPENNIVDYVNNYAETKPKITEAFVESIESYGSVKGEKYRFIINTGKKFNIGDKVSNRNKLESWTNKERAEFMASTTDDATGKNGERVVFKQIGEYIDTEKVIDDFYGEPMNEFLKRPVASIIKKIDNKVIKGKRYKLITLENAILGNKNKKAGDSKGVDKKGSKIDNISLAKGKKTAKIDELSTIVNDKVVPLKKIIDDTDVEIETYKGLKDCIL